MPTTCSSAGPKIGEMPFSVSLRAASERQPRVKGGVHSASGGGGTMGAANTRTGEPGLADPVISAGGEGGGDNSGDRAKHSLAQDPSIRDSEENTPSPD